MGMHKIATVLIWLFFACCAILELKVEAKPSSPIEIEIEAKLKLLNKPAVKTIKSEDGDIIDCVDLYKQPAFDHPILKNHTIDQRIPNFFVKNQNSSTKLDVSLEKIEAFQTWQKSGSCPKGTVPIRRILKEGLLKASNSLHRFGQKPPERLIMNFSKSNASTVDAIYDLKNRSDARLVAYGFNFIGAQADINIWNPKVAIPEDFTTAQIWLKAANGLDFESIESGWVVNPKLYGDYRTRLFAYWTKDSYKSTGCFDLTCSGFVHVSSQVALGAALNKVSSRFQQYDINIGIFWDNTKWWLRVGDIPVGYWPTSLVQSLQSSASLVQWGGQVFSDKVKESESPHTGTSMGSGYFASNRYGHACYMRNVRIKDYSQQLKYPQFVSTNAAEPDCYSTYNDHSDLKFYPETVFYFGGPGRNLPHCP